MLEVIMLASLIGTGLAVCCGKSEEDDSNDSLPDSSGCYCDWSYDSDVGSSGGDRQSTLSEC